MNADSLNPTIRPGDTETLRSISGSDTTIAPQPYDPTRGY